MDRSNDWPLTHRMSDYDCARAARGIRPDFERFYRPGKAPPWMREVMERARHPAFKTRPAPDHAKPPLLEPVGKAPEPMLSYYALFLKHWYRAEFRKYNPDQPRVPAGQTGGGQWVGGSLQPPDNDRASRRGLVTLASDISGFTRHGLNQAINRGVSPAAILNAVIQPIQILPQANGTLRYIGSNAVVVLSPSGQVVTVWGR